MPMNSSGQSPVPAVGSLPLTVRREALWVPLLTHFDASGRIDRLRTSQQVAALRPSLTGYLLAGSTGAGWKVSDDQFAQLLDLVASGDTFDERDLVLAGCLRHTTDEVIARARMAEGVLGKQAGSATFAGLTVCPPVGATSQAQILEHYQRVIEATEFPIAVYQLPQVTRCEVDAATMTELMKTGRIHMFKDTSGEDRVAASRVLGDAVWTLRGAEGGYFEALKPGGAYDGWLLSTANGFAEHYRAIRDMAARGDREGAQTLSARVTRVVNAIFELGNQMNLGNVFSNANRAIDHVQAYGARCIDVPMPFRIDGSTVPEPYLVQVSAIVRREGLANSRPYLG